MLEMHIEIVNLARSPCYFCIILDILRSHQADLFGFFFLGGGACAPRAPPLPTGMSFMIDKRVTLFIYFKMTVLDCLKPLTLSAVGNDERMLRNKFLLFANARGAGTLLTTKCPAPGTHRRATNIRGLPGGMLAAGIDSHILRPAQF